MARPRLELQALLEEQTEHVYFQPPENYKMQYPCIVYALDGEMSGNADNLKYRHSRRYQVTVIDKSPDTVIADKVIELPFCEFNRSFAADNLNHYVFTLFF